MKKFALAAVAAAAAVTFGMANAYTVGTFKNGVVVPNVIHNGPTDTTTVGLVKIGAAANSGAVRWTFFDQDSKHVRDGCFTMTENDYQPFVWADPLNSGNGLQGQRGYLVFALGNAATCAAAGSHDQFAPAAPLNLPAGLAAHAFQVNATTNDVAYTPVIDGNLTLAGGTDLAAMDENSLTAVAGAAQVGAGGVDLYMRYFLEAGASTRIVVWSTGDQKKTHTVYPFNDKQDSFSGNFKLDHTELDWFDPAAIPGWAPAYVDGFIKWTVSPTSLALADVAIAPANTASIFSYSVIDAPAFGAVQTVLGFHNP